MKLEKPHAHHICYTVIKYVGNSWKCSLFIF